MNAWLFNSILSFMWLLSTSTVIYAFYRMRKDTKRIRDAIALSEYWLSEMHTTKDKDKGIRICYFLLDLYSDPEDLNNFYENHDIPLSYFQERFERISNNKLRQ